MAAIKYYLFWLMMALFVTTKAQFQTGENFPAIIPAPAAIKQTGGNCSIIALTQIYCEDTSLYNAARLLNLYLKANGKKPLIVTNKKAAENFILVKIDTNKVTQAEGYMLTVDKNAINLVAHDIGGVIYGIETLRQLWTDKNKNNLTIPCCEIKDAPRFAYRGMALDVSRHFFPISFIKKYIDLLALYKFNTFHWHLTDDQGWRIEIKKYPKLQSVAAFRNETMIGHKKELSHRFDGKRYGGFYTQEQIKEVVQFAAQRNINIIPEIEMPGHALAALSAYPQLGCTGGPYNAATFWGIFDDVFCAGNDSTFSFLQNVLDEVMELFPSNYIHIGGDECPKTKWKACVKCQQRIKDLQLKDEHELQSYFIQRMEKYINSKGRNIIGWDEILEGGLAPNATVMSWRGEEGGIAAAKQKHAVVMTPETHVYFDYYQSLHADEPLAAGGYTPLEKVYGYEPAGNKITSEDMQFIKGVEGQAWSEYFTDEAQAEYMVFPRAIALAEVAWAQPERRNYHQFLSRLRKQQQLLKQLQVNVANNFDEIQIGAAINEQKQITASLKSSLPGATIYFTLNGNNPSVLSKKYSSPILIANTTTLKAQVYDEKKKPVGRIFQQQFYTSKSTGATVNLINPPIARFDPGAIALVNGLEGNSSYNNGQWLGFSGDNLDATIDLGKLQTISTIKMNFLNYHWQRIWAPVSFSIYTSTDSLNFKTVYTQTVFNINGINKVAAKIKSTTARFIKVVAVNKGMIPAGEYGAGGKALLLVDEIRVD